MKTVPNMADMPERLIGKKELLLIVPVSDMTIHRWEKATGEDGEPKFPQRIRLGPGRGRVAWRLSEVLAWIESKAAESRSNDVAPAEALPGDTSMMATGSVPMESS